jgi:hypothetical protein
MTARTALALAATAATCTVAVALGLSVGDTAPAPGRARATARTRVDPAVVQSRVSGGTIAPAAPAAGFSAQVRLGFLAGDQWEPAIAADAFGHVYVLYPQYLGVPGCASCPSPTMILQRSADGGTSWDAPRLIAAPGSGQWDAQIAVDPLDGRTVYASWLQNGKSDTVVARSTDFGASWTVVVADRTNAGTDKPALAVRGQAVHVGFNHANKVWVASSLDGGRTFVSREVRSNAKLGWALAGGAAVGPEGNVYVGWAGYKQNGGAKGPVNLFVSRSTDGGLTWANHVLAVSGAPPDCSAFECGWAYLGAQVTVAVDEAGTVYALWNAGAVDKGPERMFFARSLDAGATWSPATEVSRAAAGVAHAFPALAARGDGEVRVLWMDDRSAGAWNTYARRSNDGGATFGAETDLSTPVAGFDYITPAGFRFPFGDYFEADFDAQGTLHAVFGEGHDYLTPGSIWYVRGR